MLAWPLIRITIGDIRKVGPKKLPYGPNTQIARDRHISLLDIGTMAHIHSGRIKIHGGIESQQIADLITSAPSSQ